MFKFQMYKKLQANIGSIYQEAREVASTIGIPDNLKGKFGLTGAISGCPAPLREDISRYCEEGGKEVTPLAKLVDEIRELVKTYYGDEYDAAPVNTCEAGLWVTFDSLFTPPSMGRGDNYRTRYLIPAEKHLHHHGGYGRPFPPRFKDVFADRGSTAGEAGFSGKRQNNMDTLIVPMVGAEYPVHGIKYWPVPLLSGVDAEKTALKMAEVAGRHAGELTGITSLGYETPGYGYGQKDEDGTPILQKRLAALANQYDIPYVIDNAWGIPFVGTDIRKTGAHVVIYSMDKASGATTSGLVIGKEEYMVPIRRALGMHGDRWGTTASYGKAAYVTQDPGKEALLGQIAAMKALLAKPEVVTQPVDDLYRVVEEEFAQLDASLRKGIIISKSHNSTAVEVNYEGTWANGQGIPIFTIEDMYAGSNILQSGLAQMGVIPTIAYDANIYISPGLGTTDEHGRLLEDRSRLAIKALVRLIEIVCKYAYN
ncbi:MAG: hypothetical protein KGZ79_11435 [Dethiobacter sp.]|jgi:hypothetical protein|nr:hypothetical protein [Dethiobacter sp.]